MREHVGGGLADRLAFEHRVREEIAAIRSIPPSPFRMRQILTGAVVYALPATLGIIQSLQLVV